MPYRPGDRQGEDPRSGGSNFQKGESGQEKPDDWSFGQFLKNSKQALFDVDLAKFDPYLAEMQTKSQSALS